jgi:guanylate kinase
MLTNYPYPQYRKESYSNGADYFFSKSDEFEEVFSTITQLAESA